MVKGTDFKFEKHVSKDTTYMTYNLPVELRQQDICLTEFRRLLKTVLFL